jgi:hypothetical protein
VEVDASETLARAVGLRGDRRYWDPFKTRAQLDTCYQSTVIHNAWSVSKVTTSWKSYGVVQGVMWRLPKKMFTDLGGRLTGSIALTFIPSHIQQKNAVCQEPTQLEPGSVLAHAVVFGPFGSNQRAVWARAQNAFISLQIAPRIPTNPRPSGNAG